MAAAVLFTVAVNPSSMVVTVFSAEVFVVALGFEVTSISESVGRFVAFFALVGGVAVLFVVVVGPLFVFIEGSSAEMEVVAFEVGVTLFSESVGRFVVFSALVGAITILFVIAVDLLLFFVEGFSAEVDVVACEFGVTVFPGAVNKFVAVSALVGAIVVLFVTAVDPFIAFVEGSSVDVFVVAYEFGVILFLGADGRLVAFSALLGATTVLFVVAVDPFIVFVEGSFAKVFVAAFGL